MPDDHLRSIELLTATVYVDEVNDPRRDFVADLMIASAMRHAVAQQPAKTKRIAVVAA
jgi:hypothetical protein